MNIMNDVKPGIDKNIRQAPKKTIAGPYTIMLSKRKIVAVTPRVKKITPIAITK